MGRPFVDAIAKSPSENYEIKENNDVEMEKGDINVA